MTDRERLMTLVAGGKVDGKPTIAWPSSEISGAEFVPITNLYRHFQLMGEDPVALLKDTDSSASQIVEEAEGVRYREARGAIDGGAIGVFYEIHGADASRCTPMEYGGLFLERDRAFLESVADAPCNFVYINGKEPYLDFVSDLPAQIFGWDAVGSGIVVAEVRKLRTGLLATNDPQADIILDGGESITDRLEGKLAHV